MSQSKFNIKNILQKAIGLHQSGQLEQAEELYNNILDTEPLHSDSLHLLGLIAYQTRKLEEAFLLIEKAVSVCPDSPLYLNNLGLVLKDLRRYDEAISACKKALKLKPDFAEACNTIASICEDQENHEEALHYYQKLIILQPDNEQTYYKMGYLFKQIGQQEKAVNAYKMAIEIVPSYAEAWNDLGNIVSERGELKEALICYENALKNRKDFAKAHNNVANIYIKRGDLSQAIHSYKKALLINSDSPAIYYNLGNAYQKVGESENAIQCYENALQCDPSYLEASTQLIHQLQQSCQWYKLPVEINRFNCLLPEAIAKREINTEAPFVSISIHEDPKLNFEIAQARSKSIEKNMSKIKSEVVFQKNQKKRDKITIGYLSNDFRNHPVAHLILGLFKLHDRNRFNIFCYSSSSEGGEKYRDQIKKDCDNFVDIETMTDIAAAQKIYEDEVDILIDLMGHTRGNRLGIFALKPAPIQVSYLGFPGTTGAKFIDYIMADHIVAPKEDSPFYSEKIIWLPNCYQINNNEEQISAKKCQRSDFGLPEKYFVFSSFNQTYKIEPVMFEVWMNILKKVPASVLWLLRYGDASAKKLREEADTRGIDGARLRFTGMVPKDEHLARIKLADLALDTRTYNGHTSTSDALWAGLPVITLQGNHFASRVSSSILSAINLHELITHSPEQYEELAISLALNSSKLRLINNKLLDNRLSTPLFDTSKFTRNLESAYLKMWERYEVGLENTSFEVKE